MIKRLLLTVAALSLLVSSAAALSPSRAINQFHHTSWTMADGLPAAVWSMAQTPDGYLWLGTGLGLYSFDGVRFDRFTQKTGPDPLGIDITALIALPSGDLWIGYQNGGVSRLRNGRLTNFSHEEGVPTGSVGQFESDSNNNLWVAADNGLARFDGARWTVVGENFGVPAGAVRALSADMNGEMWVVVDDKILCLRPGSRNFNQVTKGPQVRFGLALAGHPTPLTHRLSVGDLATVFRQFYRKSNPSNASRSSRAVFDNDGTLWASNREHGIYRIRHAAPFDRSSLRAPTKVDHFGLSEGLSSDIATSLLEGREGNVWVATNRGLDRFRPATAVTEPSIPVTSLRGYRVAAAGPASLYITGGSALFKVGRAGSPILAIKHLEPPAFTYVDSSGALWLGGRGSLRRIDRGQIHLVLLPKVTPKDVPWAWAITQSPDKHLWLSIKGRGIFQRAGERWELLPSPFSIVDVAPRIMQADGYGGVWLYYPGGDVVLFEGGQFHRLGNLRASIGEVEVIYPFLGGVLLGGELGLARYDGHTFQTLRADHIPPLTLTTGIVETRTHEIWLNTNLGVVRTSARDLDRALRDANVPLKYQFLEAQDGLSGVAEQDSFQNTAALGPDNRVWFITSHGVDWLDPAQLNHNPLAPPVFIRAIAAHGRSYDPAQVQRLDSNASDLRIDYTALTFTTPERAQFKYRLSGVDQDWVDAGTRRQAFYTKLGPGSYRFRVIASNGDGVWNNTGAAVDFRIAPTFFQTNLFWLICAGASFCGLWCAYTIRMRIVARNIRDLLEERLLERERIARELHDTLLQSVQGLILHFQSASDLIPSEQQAHQSMEDALNRADDVLIEGRDRVRNLRAGEGDGSLSETLTDAARRVMFGPETEVSVLVEGAPVKLHAIVTEEVKRIADEALFNILQHANAARVNVGITFSQRRLTVRFEDNGVGIAKGVLEGQERHDRFGLTGIRERAKRIHGELVIASRPGTGTVIALSIPAQVAYAETNGRPWLLLWRKRQPKLEGS